MTPTFRTETRLPGRYQRCPCCLARWSSCPCTSVMCPRGSNECIDHCRCFECRELRAGGVAAAAARPKNEREDQRP